MDMKDSKPGVIAFPLDFSDATGGAQRSTLEIIKSLDRSRWEPLVILPTGGDLNRTLRDLGVATVEVGSPLKWSHTNIVCGSRDLIGVIRALRSVPQLKIVHCNFVVSMLWVALAKRWLRGVKLIWHDRGNAEYSGKVIAMVLAVAANIDRLIATTEICRQRWLDLGFPSSKIVVIPNSCGWSVDEVAPANLSEYGVPKSATRAIVKVARIDRLKNIETFIHGMEIVRRRFPEVHGVIVGGPGLAPHHQLAGTEYLRELKDLSGRLGQGEYIHWVGSVSEPEVASIVAASSVLVGTATSESFGRVYIEAFSLGIPVVATDVGGVRDVVTHNVSGFLVPAKDPQSLASCVVRLLDDPELADRFGANALNEFRTRFSRPVVAKQLDLLYNSVAGS